jgi:hypothetical protein
MSNATRVAKGGEEWLPTISAKHVLPFDREAGAWAHWVLGPSPDNLVDNDNSNRTLTPETYLLDAANGFVTLASVSGNALVSTLPDATVGTWCAVFRVSATPTVNRIPIVGTLSTAGNSGMHAMINTVPAIQVYGEESTGTPFTANFHSSYAFANRWLFIAIARDFDLVIPEVSVYIGSQGVETNTYSGAVYNTGHDVAFASVANGLIGSGQPDLLLAEGMFFETRLTTDEMEAVYLRSKERMSYFGRTVT